MSKSYTCEFNRYLWRIVGIYRESGVWGSGFPWFLRLMVQLKYVYIYAAICKNTQICVCAYIHVCVVWQLNLDGLLEKIWEYLDLVRIYTKPKGQIPDYTAPVILSSSRCRVEDFCLRIHKSLLDEFKLAIVWGRSVKHNPQKVGKEHMLTDEDVVQIVKK